MPLQNRVRPDGEIVAEPWRGAFTGNRGIIHDPATRTLLKRRWSSRAWIICVCDFRGRRRDVMASRSWTELFFYDEACALAAGHRPCFYCRPDDARRFRDCFAVGNGLSEVKAAQMDAILHEQRLDGRTKRLHPRSAFPGSLPDGAMIIHDGHILLASDGCFFPWSPDGYGPPRHSDIDRGAVALLTPPASMNALAQGYRAKVRTTDVS